MTQIAEEQLQGHQNKKRTNTARPERISTRKSISRSPAPFHINCSKYYVITVTSIIIMPILLRDATVSALRSASISTSKRILQHPTSSRVPQATPQRLSSLYDNENNNNEPVRQDDDTEQQHLVLVGGGHAHAQVIKALNAASRPSNLKVTLIDQQSSAPYSGMVPGCISGRYTPDETLLHLKPLTEWAGIDFVHERVVDIDLSQKIVHLARHCNAENENNIDSSSSIPFDCISLDIGSTSRGLDDTPGARQFTIPTRPISKLVERIERSEQDMIDTMDDTSNEDTTPPRVVVIGGGAAGVELSMSLNGRFKFKFSNTQVTLLDAGTELLPDESKQGKAALKDIMTKQEIQVVHQCQVEEVTEDRIFALVNGKKCTIPFTHCIWATGAGAHPLAFRLQNKGLDATKHGWISVNEYLQSTSHPFVFAAGDCCSIEGLPNGSPPKAGVFAVRAGPVLIDNLTTFLKESQSQNNEKMKKYVPQSDFLKLLVCGDGRALGLRFGQAFVGRWVMEMKDSIDQNFMNLFKRENLPDLNEGEEYDTSQYDANMATKSELNPGEAAALLSRTDDDVDYQEAWNAIRTMADDDNYQQQVQSFLTEGQQKREVAGMK